MNEPTTPPVRLLEVRRVRFYAATGASALATALFFACYYGTFALLPPTGATLLDHQTHPMWLQRLDVSQFVGTLFLPPDPTWLTWWIGAVALFALLTTSGVFFAILCAWTLSRPTTTFGIAYGGALFFALTSAISLGSGYNPAVMRQSLPDVGTFFLGWSPWPAIQLLACFSVYGWTLGALYRRWTSVD
jgi:hypothetical protein